MAPVFAEPDVAPDVDVVLDLVRRKCDSISFLKRFVMPCFATEYYET